MGIIRDSSYNTNQKTSPIYHHNDFNPINNKNHNKANDDQPLSNKKQNFDIIEKTQCEYNAQPKSINHDAAKKHEAIIPTSPPFVSFLTTNPITSSPAAIYGIPIPKTKGIIIQKNKKQKVSTQDEQNHIKIHDQQNNDEQNIQNRTHMNIIQKSTLENDNTDKEMKNDILPKQKIKHDDADAVVLFHSKPLISLTQQQQKLFHPAHTISSIQKILYLQGHIYFNEKLFLQKPRHVTLSVFSINHKIALQLCALSLNNNYNWTILPHYSLTRTHSRSFVDYLKLIKQFVVSLEIKDIKNKKSNQTQQQILFYVMDSHNVPQDVIALEKEYSCQTAKQISKQLKQKKKTTITDDLILQDTTRTNNSESVSNHNGNDNHQHNSNNNDGNINSYDNNNKIDTQPTIIINSDSNNDNNNDEQTENGNCEKKKNV
jgi:hypothetical protein